MAVNPPLARIVPRAESLTDHTSGKARVALELVSDAVKTAVPQSFVMVTLAGVIVMTVSVVCVVSHPTIAIPVTTTSNIPANIQALVFFIVFLLILSCC
jgi:hypothetical protein